MKCFRITYIAWIDEDRDLIDMHGVTLNDVLSYAEKYLPNLFYGEGLVISLSHKHRKKGYARDIVELAEKKKKFDIDVIDLEKWRNKEEHDELTLKQTLSFLKKYLPKIDENTTIEIWVSKNG